MKKSWMLMREPPDRRVKLNRQVNKEVLGIVSVVRLMLLFSPIIREVRQLNMKIKQRVLRAKELGTVRPRIWDLLETRI